MSNIIEAREMFNVLRKNILENVEAYLKTYQSITYTCICNGFRISEGPLEACLEFAADYTDPTAEDDGCEYATIKLGTNLSLHFLSADPASAQFFLFKLSTLMNRISDNQHFEVKYLARDAATIAKNNEADRIAHCKWSMFRFLTESFSKLDLRYGRTGVLAVPEDMKNMVAQVLSAEPFYTQNVENAVAAWYHDRVEVKRNKKTNK